MDSNLLFPYITGNCYRKGYLEILHRNHAILLTCVCFTSSLFVANTFDATSYNQTDPTSSPANITEHAGTDIVKKNGYAKTEFYSSLLKLCLLYIPNFSLDAGHNQRSIKRKCALLYHNLRFLTFYTLISVCILSILFSTCFLRC